MKEKSIFNENYFKILDYLEASNQDSLELQSKFNMSEKVFLKHITNLRKAGFKILKKNNTYFYDKFYNTLDLTIIEKSLLAHILTLADTYLNKTKNEKIANLIEKIAHLASAKDYSEILEKFLQYKKLEFCNTYNDKIKLLEKFIENKEKISIILRSKRELITIPKELFWKNSHIRLKYFEQNKIKSIPIEKIVKISSLNTPKETIRSTEVFFELYGNLAKSYLLKDDERIADIFQDKIIVASSQKDKNKLFKRLLRYDTLCKVILPKADVEHFKTMINKAIDNLSILNIEAEK